MKKKTKKSKKTDASVRKPPPKRTGKSGIGPLESDETPVQQQEPVSESSASDVSESRSERTAHEGALVGEEIKEEGKASLLAEQPPRPVVVGDRIEAHFLKPTFSRMADGKRLMALHMSFPLTEEHTEDNLLPKRIRDDWSLINKNGRTYLEITGIKGQRVGFYLSHDAAEDDEKMVLPAAKVSNVSLAAVQAKGTGEAKTVIRLSYRLQIPVSHEIAVFAVMNYGTNFWITMRETDEPLFDEEE